MHPSAVGLVMWLVVAPVTAVAAGDLGWSMIRLLARIVRAVHLPH